jgi:hypothetical protein
VAKIHQMIVNESVMDVIYQFALIYMSTKNVSDIRPTLAGRGCPPFGVRTPFGVPHLVRGALGKDSKSINKILAVLPV